MYSEEPDRFSAGSGFSEYLKDRLVSSPWWK
jgi:hypothetical protein